MNHTPIADKSASQRHLGHIPANSPQNLRVPQVMPPRHNAQPSRLPRARRPRKRMTRRWVVIIPVGIVLALLFSTFIGFIALRMAFANVIFPQVSANGIALGGMTQAEAAQVLDANWDTITLRDGDRTWDVAPETLGVILNAGAMAAAAYAHGHSNGQLNAFFTPLDVTPVIDIYEDAAVTFLIAMSQQIDIPPVNAGVAFVDGEVTATDASTGRSVDVLATVQALVAEPQLAADGAIDLVMKEIQPAVTDASPIVEQARILLSNPLELRVYDPVSDESSYLSIQPEQWGAWITAEPDPTSTIGLSLIADANLIRASLAETVAATFTSSQSINYDEAARQIRAQLAAQRLDTVLLTMQHDNRIHIVQAGETLTSIGWDYGVPYLYIQELNNISNETLRVGQALTIPPADMFLELPIVADKRIVVSISQQRVRVYESGALKWDWLASTGVSESPTWTGVYQIQSHEDLAYAANWDLYMPNFMGVYQPVPGAGFTNGFHGFPTRGGGRLLWENDLGRRVTYGCILLSDANMQLLYSWADEGVIVEIVP